jgi:hypothetical protein
MKTMIKTAITILISIVAVSEANTQDINWHSLKKEDKHIININAGYEYGLVFGAGYGYQTRLVFPMVINVGYSFPSGENLIDDFKTKIGVKVRLYSIANFQFTANIQGIYRHYENNLVRMQNFGSDLSGIVGYYRSKWFVAGEIGFDKAIVTHLKHSPYYREIFPEVKDGWYGPPSGGNFYYGLQTGFSFKQHDIYLKAGKIITQDFKTKPIVPFFAQLGYNFKFKSKKAGIQ